MLLFIFSEDSLFGGSVPLPGAPGCNVHLDLDPFYLIGSLQTPVVAGSGTVTVAIPAGLGSMDVYAQSVCFTNSNPAHLLTSNMVTARAGN